MDWFVPTHCKIEKIWSHVQMTSVLHASAAREQMTKVLSQDDASVEVIQAACEAYKDHWHRLWGDIEHYPRSFVTQHPLFEWVSCKTQPLRSTCFLLDGVLTSYNLICCWHKQEAWEKMQAEATVAQELLEGWTTAFSMCHKVCVPSFYKGLATYASHQARMAQVSARLATFPQVSWNDVCKEVTQAMCELHEARSIKHVWPMNYDATLERTHAILLASVAMGVFRYEHDTKEFSGFSRGGAWDTGSLGDCVTLLQAIPDVVAKDVYPMAELKTFVQDLNRDIYNAVPTGGVEDVLTRRLDILK